LQQKPFLLLTNTQGFIVAPKQALRQAIAQPASGAGKQTNVIFTQTHFFIQLPIQGRFRRFALVNTALRKLPSTLTNPTRPQHLTLLICEHDANVGPKSVRINHCITYCFNFVSIFYCSTNSPPWEFTLGLTPQKDEKTIIKRYAMPP
jgi:hypothetical protein